MKEVVPQDRRPPLLGRTPTLESLSHVQDALKLLAWFQSRAATVNTACEQSCRLLRNQAAKELQIDVEGEKLTFAQYCVALEEAIRDFVARNPELWAERRTIELPHGTVAIKRQPTRLELETGMTAAQWCTEVKERHGLVSKLIAWLKRQKLWPWVRLSVELNLSEIKRAFSQEEVTRDEVEAMGLRVIDAHDAVVITPTMKPASREQAA